MTERVPAKRRALRFLARTVGVPTGVVLVWLLRLTGRKAGIALLYHSVGPRSGDPSRELVPPHEIDLFRRQIRYVRRHFAVVPASELQEAARARRRGQRFPVAITFDDDLSCHETVALPVLRQLGATATFFLSGASLDGPFAFHYERLQRAFDEGLADVDAIVLGTQVGSGGHDVHRLGRLLEEMSPGERDAAAARLAAALGPDPPDAGIRASQVRALADSGMTVGFHTLRHDALTLLSDDALRDAMRLGRDALAEAAGQPLTTIGYPHGRADERVADAARAAGFVVGFTSGRTAVVPTDDPLLQARLEPSLRSVGALAAEFAVTLFRTGGNERSTRARARRAS